MSSRRTLTAFFFSALTFSVAASAGSLGGSGTYQVEAVADLLVADVNVKGHGPAKATEDNGKLILTADLVKLNMSERTKHTREAFLITCEHLEGPAKEKCKPFPTAKLTVEKSALKLPESNDVSGKVKGDLTLHGVTKPVTVTYTAGKTGDGYKVKKATFTFNYPDFGVEKICKMKACVKPPVTISVENVTITDK